MLPAMKIPAIQQRLQQSAPIEPPAVAVYFGALLLSQDLVRVVEAICREADLSMPQYNALRILRGAGPDGLACGELAARMIHRVPDVTRLVNRLEARGLVRRERQPEDRRVVRVWLAGEGARLIAPLDAQIPAALDTALAMLPPDSRTALAELLDRALPHRPE